MIYPVSLKTIASLALYLALYSCTPALQQEEEGGSESTEYDPELAQRLGADDYGMKPYVMAFLKSGPNRPADSLEQAELQRAHLDNITRLAEDGKLVLAGPFMDDGEIRGIYIFNVSTIEEAKALSQTDPAIQKGSLVMELHPWYGSASIDLINEWHKKISKEGI